MKGVRESGVSQTQVTLDKSYGFHRFTFQLQKDCGIKPHVFARWAEARAGYSCKINLI